MSDTYGSGLSGFGAPESTGSPAFPQDSPGSAPQAQMPEAPQGGGAEPQEPQAPKGPSFGQNMRSMLPGAHYTPPDPQTSPLDQAADLLTQRVKRAGAVATNPLAQIFAPEQAQAARDFMPKAAEELQKIEKQKSAIMAGRVEARTLDIDPGEVSDQATQEDRLTIARDKALSGNIKAFQGIQAVKPDVAASIAPQVYEKVASHLSNAQLAFDSLASMQNEGQYQAKLKQLRSDGTLSELEGLGMKVPGSFEAFSATKALEGRALREARIGINKIGQQLEERNTYQPMEGKEQDAWKGRHKTVYGDVADGKWSRNAASNTPALVTPGIATVDDLGKTGAIGSAEQRKEIGEAFRQSVPKEEIEKQRAFSRTLTLAEPTAEQKKRGQTVNDNPNVQQGIAEGLASMLRGGSGGANIGLLKIETSKRGVIQSLLDKAVTEYGGAVNTISKEQIRPYLTTLTQNEMREVLDGLKQWNDSSLDDRAKDIARRAGALGFDVSALGLGKNETKGAIAEAVEEGRQAQIAAMRPNFQPIGGGDGAWQVGAQRPGAGAAPLPPGAQPANQLPGAAPLQTPVQQAQQPSGPGSGGGGQPPAPTGVTPAQPAPAPAPAPQPGAPAGGPPGVPSPAPQAPQPSGPAPGAPSPAGPSPVPGAPAPVTVAGQQVNVALPPGVSPTYVAKMQRIESGNSKDPWTAEVRKTDPATGKPISSASGAFQMLDRVWEENKPAGAPARAKDATPAQQAEALGNLAKRDAATLTANGVPVTDTSLYIAHNLGGRGGSKLMTADLDADAREVVGEVAARNNPKFFKGRPTVATVLQRYAAEMQDDGTATPGVRTASLNTGVQNDGSEPPARTPAEAAAARMQRSTRHRETGALDTSGERRTQEQLRNDWLGVKDAAVEHAPAIGSTVGAVGGFFTPVPGGTAIGGAAGGAAGQALKDYLQGRDQSPKRIAKEGALGAALGLVPQARPVVGALTRATAAGTVGAVGKATEPGSNAADIIEAGVKDAGLAAGGEAFGRALGMGLHKAYKLFTPDAQAAVRTAAKELHDASEILKTEPPKLPGVGGAAGVANPKYEAAEAAKTKAEATIKEMLPNAKPEEVAYAHKVNAESEANVKAGGDAIPKQEAQVTKPGNMEKEQIGAGYQQIEKDVADNTRGQKNIKPTAALPNGPVMVAQSNKMSPDMQRAAERTEMVLTAPAKNWQEKWTQVKDARSALLDLERDARSSTTAGRKQIGDDYRTLANSVRKQQEAMAEHVFGPTEGPKVIKRLEVLDARYRRLMEATNNGDLQAAARLKGEEGRAADAAFRAFAQNDHAAIAAWNAMRTARSDVERDVRTGVLSEKIPVLGHLISAVKLAATYSEWRAARAAGSPVKFSDLLPELKQRGTSTARDLLAQTGARAAVSAGATQ